MWPGVAGLVRSARANSGTPDAFRFHLITLPAEVEAARRTMECFDIARHMAIVGLPADLLTQRVRVTADPKVTGHLASPLNFVRFHMQRLLPRSTRRVLYLDADTIVQSDLALLAATPLPPPYAYAAVPRADLHFRYKRYVKQCGALYAGRHHGETAALR